MTDKKAKHTPGPWAIYEDVGKRHCITTGDGIYNLAWVPANGEVCKANAEFIVRACNSFDDLLAAVKALLPLIVRHTCHFHGAMVCDGCETVKRAEAAISKAEPGGVWNDAS